MKIRVSDTVLQMCREYIKPKIDYNSFVEPNTEF